MQKEYCHIPVAAQYCVYDAEITSSQYIYREVEAAALADLLIRGFGVDVGDLMTSDNNRNDAA